MAPRVQPGNPQWVDIVDAKARKLEDLGSKSFQTYKRAAKSLRNCPITFTHPEEAIALDGIGKGIAKYIFDKLTDQANERGLPPPERHEASPPRRKAPAAKTTKKRARQEEEEEEDRKREARRLRTQGLAAPAAPPALGFQAHPDGAFAGLPVNVSDDDGEEGTTGGKGRGKAKEKGKRAYLPKKESGPYAILLALYLNSSFDEKYQWATKADIIRDGTKYSRTSFEKPTANKGGVAVEGGAATNYSAWSGMAIRESDLKLLLTKELVIKDNKRPAQFQLSPEGYQLAERLATDAGIELHVYHPSSSNGHPSSSGLGGRQPSSSGFNGAGPSSGGIVSSSFGGRGQTLGGQNSSIHAQTFRRRSPTPMDFLDLPTEDPEELELRQALKESLEMSRPGAGDPVANILRQTAARAAEGRMGGSGAASSSSAAFRPAGSTSSGINGRKAALGNIGASTSANQAPQGPSIANVDGAFGYYYLTENGVRTTDRDLAEVSQSEDGADMLYRIEYRIAQDLHSMRRGLHKVEKLTRSVPLGGGQTMSGYMKARVSNATAPGFPESSLSGNGATKPKEKKQSDDPFSSLLAGFQDTTSKSKDAMYQPPAEIRRLGGGRVDLFEPVNHQLPPVKKSQTLDIPPHQAIAGPSSASNSRKAASQPIAGSAHSHSQPRPPVPAPVRPLASSASAILASASIRAPPGTTHKRPLQVCYETLPGQTAIDRHPLIPFSEPKPFHCPSFQPIIWPAGSFKVFLMIDTREGTREGGKRIEFCEKIAREGVRVDRAMLPLGDMIWVARKVDSRGNKIQGEQDVVLDAIVERKRLDDLVDSIKDGRYVDQKIRLKDSAITDRIYLIEKYDDKIAYETYGKAIWTCKSQLQVIDGFYVHESGNVEETLNYLKMRTQIMAELYESTEIRIIPDQVIDRSSYVALQQHLRTTQPSHRYLTTYSSFFELNKSDAGLTIRIQWASMIQRIKGMSAEKAIQFLSRWETAVQFHEEAKEWEREIGEENRRLDREEAEGRGPKGKGKGKRRKREDFVVAALGETTLPRPIKGKLGSDLWALLMTEDKY